MLPGLPVPGSMFKVAESEELPETVVAAYERAASTGFQFACEVEVGRLLATLAAAVPNGGRILEIGTGVGVGLAWLVHGLVGRQDVEVVTVELDDVVQQMARSAPGHRGSASSRVTGPKSSAASVGSTLYLRTRPEEDLQAPPDHRRPPQWRCSRRRRHGPHAPRRRAASLCAGRCASAPRRERRSRLRRARLQQRRDRGRQAPGVIFEAAHRKLVTERDSAIGSLDSACRLRAVQGCTIGAI